MRKELRGDATHGSRGPLFASNERSRAELSSTTRGRTELKQRPILIRVRGAVDLWGRKKGDDTHLRFCEGPTCIGSQTRLRVHLLGQNVKESEADEGEFELVLLVEQGEDGGEEFDGERWEEDGRPCDDRGKA